MNMMKRISLLGMALLMVLSLAACGGSGAEETKPAVDSNGNVEYRVTLKDAAGNVYNEGIIVKFLQDGQEMAMQVVGQDGTAVKSLPAGEYTVELVYTDSEAAYHYDASNVTVTAEAPALEILMAQTIIGEPELLFADGEEHQAYRVPVGSTQVSLNAGKRTYFLFVPEQAGTYAFGVVDDVAAVGYYGAPHFVQSQSAVEVVDNVVQVSVSTGNLGGSLVIGLDSDSADSCVLTVERIGDAEKTWEDEPWQVYQATAALSPYTLPTGAALQNFDITSETDAYNLVLNEADGFYHLDSADGPLVLVRLAGEMDYLDPYKTILEHTGVVKYFYDENDEFVSRENYTDCLLRYIENADEEAGVYPLTEDLKYIIQQSGDHSGWFDASATTYIFKDEGGNIVPGVNEEISWLFMCCWLKG